MKRTLKLTALIVLVLAGTCLAAPMGGHGGGHGGGNGFPPPPPNGGNHNPGHGNHDGWNNNPGHGNGHEQPPLPPSNGGHNNPGHGNDNGWNNNNNGHGNGHGQPPLPPNPGHGNDHGWNNNPGHGNNYPPLPPNHGGHDDHGYYPPLPPNPPSNSNYQVKRIHSEIKNLFYRVQDYSYQGTNPREFARILGQISNALSDLAIEVPYSSRDEVRSIRDRIERARFTLVTENDYREAVSMTRRAEDQYRRLMDRILGYEA